MTLLRIYSWYIFVNVRLLCVLLTVLQAYQLSAPPFFFQIEYNVCVYVCVSTAFFTLKISFTIDYYSVSFSTFVGVQTLDFYLHFPVTKSGNTVVNT